MQAVVQRLCSITACITASRYGAGSGSAATPYRVALPHYRPERGFMTTEAAA
jgi:hypothetical protein